MVSLGTRPNSHIQYRTGKDKKGTKTVNETMVSTRSPAVINHGWDEKSRRTAERWGRIRPTGFADRTDAILLLVHFLFGTRR